MWSYMMSRDHLGSSMWLVSVVLYMVVIVI